MRWIFLAIFLRTYIDSCRSIGKASVQRVMTRPFYLQIRSYLSWIPGFPMHSLPLSLCYAVFRIFIFEARKRLKANCLHKVSMAFLTILGNLSRYALLYKWLNPKYCSTIYQTLKMALFLAVLYSVSSAPVVSLRMMPSSILFKARNWRFGFPKYPLSANTFLMGSLVCPLNQGKIRLS